MGLTYLKGLQPAARLPPPVAISLCSRPASAAAVQQLSPSVTRRLIEARCSATSFLISFLRKPLTGSRSILRGRRSSPVETAATKGCFRPLPPRTLPAEIRVVHLDPAVQPLPALPATIFCI